MILRSYLVLAALLALVGAAYAAQERYDYDSLGRLIRYIDQAGQVTEYVYDAVGNILEVRRGVAVQPSIASVVPDIVRRGQSVPVQVLGSGLAGRRSPRPMLGCASPTSTPGTRRSISS